MTNKQWNTLISIIIFLFGIYWAVMGIKESSFLLGTVGLLCILIAYILDKEKED